MTYSSPLLDTVLQRCSKNAMGIPSDDLNIQRHLVCRLGTSCFAQQCHGSRLRHCSSYLAPGTVRPPATLRSTWFHLVQQLPIPGSRASTIECSLTWGQDDQDISRYILIYQDISRYLKMSKRDWFGPGVDRTWQEHIAHMLQINAAPGYRSSQPSAA